MINKKEIAIIYDVDGTLSKGNLPEHKLFPDFGINTKAAKEAFWIESEKFAKKNDIDGILSYMYLIMQKASEKNIKLSKQMLNESGPEIPLFKGVTTWFDRINKIARDDYVIKHYIISSGLHEMIETMPIKKHFEAIFASKYIYDENGFVVSPGVAINYTTKMQYLFRINKKNDANKDMLNHWNSKGLNTWMPMKNRPVPFERMIYLGDGDTDIPAMKTVKIQNGFSIGVLDPDKWKDAKHQEKISKLTEENRVNHVAPADYSANSQLDLLVKGLLTRIINEDK